MHSLRFVACVVLTVGCGDGGDAGPDGGALPDGNAACVARDAVRIADATKLHGLVHEAGAARLLVERGTPASLVLVGEGMAERVLSTAPVAGAALATRWDGALCAAWIGMDDTFHAACGPDWVCTGSA